MWQRKIKNLSGKKDLSLKINMTKYFQMRKKDEKLMQVTKV